MEVFRCCGVLKNTLNNSSYGTMMESGYGIGWNAIIINVYLAIRYLDIDIGFSPAIFGGVTRPWIVGLLD